MQQDMYANSRWKGGSMKRNIPETLNKILSKSMEIYRRDEDLGATIFLFERKGRILEIPITERSKARAIEFSKKDIYGIAIAGKFDVQEQHLLSLQIPTLGMNSVGIMYHSGTEDYFFYTKILQYDLEPGQSFSFSEIKRLSRKDGFQLNEGFIKNIFPTVH